MKNLTQCVSKFPLSTTIQMYGIQFSMWLITKIPPKAQSLEHIADLMLSISPQITVFQSHILIDLRRLHRYWQLGSLVKNFDPESISTNTHALIKRLMEWHRRFDMCFLLAPTAASGFLIYQNKNASRHPIDVLDPEDYLTRLQSKTVTDGAPLVADLLQKDPRLSTQLMHINEFLVDMQLHRLTTLLEISKDPLKRSAFVERMGSLMDVFFKRLNLHRDFELPLYEAPKILNDIFYPEMERHLSLSETPVLDRVREILDSWEERLGYRRAAIKGLDLHVISARQRQSYSFPVRLPKATRDAGMLFKVVSELWHQKSQHPTTQDFEFFEDDIASIRLSSHRLEELHSKQLNLFDPGREDSDEQWNSLIAQLKLRARRDAEVWVGRFNPKESFVPEHAIAWVDWEDETAPHDPIADHPARPTLLFKVPQPLPEIRVADESSFLHYVASQQGNLLCERIRDPWIEGAQALERSYARIGSRWVFWDNTRKKVFLHGYFE